MKNIVNRVFSIFTLSQSALWRETVEVRRMNLPRGLSTLELSVTANDSHRNTAPSLPTLEDLDGIEISEVDFHPGSDHQ
jgi:hypothetical protein